MERRNLKENRHVCRFFRWAKKSYAAFNSLHRVVEISRLRSSMVDSSLVKQVKSIDRIFARGSKVEEWSESWKCNERLANENSILTSLYLLLMPWIFMNEMCRSVFGETNNNNIIYRNANSRSRIIKRLRLFCCQNVR